jgi:hypothetical protein
MHKFSQPIVQVNVTVCKLKNAHKVDFRFEHLIKQLKSVNN